MKRILSLFAAGVLLLGVAPASITHAARHHGGGGAPSAPSSVTVLVGLGQVGVSPGSYLGYAPRYVDVTAGDTVVFKNIDMLEPHTVSFGPMSLLKQLSQGIFVPVPQKNGPPLLTGNPKAVYPTVGNIYNGTDFANSGLMRPNQTWNLTFTQPGTYRYICLIHGLTMQGVVTVHPPQQGHLVIVQAGDGPAAFNDQANNTTNDSFYPRHVTIHVGDTVEWIGGFHTITFGPEAMIRQIEQNLFIPQPQPGGGPPLLVFNSKAAYPSGGSTYDGTGFVSSGILVFRNPNSKAPPTYKLTFTAPGTFGYDCLVHPGMDATVTVMP